MRVFLSAGEPSGDHHAALLCRAIRARCPEAVCVGLGGPEMARAGCELVADLTQLAVMWFLRVIVNIHRFVELARRAERSFLDDPPDVCVLVDFPGFHWWLAWRAKRHGIPVVFYCPPQIWAWASWRIGKMRRLVDHVLSALPFEHDWFMAQGMASTMVGHPFFDEQLAADPPDTAASAGPLVLLLPGSRGQEIEANLGCLVRAARMVEARVPSARFVIAALHQRHATTISQQLSGALAVEQPARLSVAAGRTSALIPQADAAMSVSGSVSLELLAARVPTVIVYSISRWAYVVQSWLRHTRAFTLVNLLAIPEPIGPLQPVWRPPRELAPADPAMLFPEYLAVQDPAPAASGHVIDWLTDPMIRERSVNALEKLAQQVAQPGSATRAAAAVLAIAVGGCPEAAVAELDCQSTKPTEQAA
ncbi:MAG: lipid-A-disaccharide synthase [Planctomycetia bacterium]|nr:lipid-A-disaccharide synthase [Planctomycetia bacterium]